jgi:hypothetical protein
MLPEALEPLARPFYVLAAILILLPAADFVGTVAPTQWGEMRWRFGMLGILSGFLLTPLFGSVVTMAMAAMMEHRRVQLAASFVNGLLGTIILAAFALFVLDSVQIRAQVGPDSVRAFDLVVLRTGAKLFICMVVYYWLAMAGVKSYRKTRLPEGWQPGDPVPIVNTDSVNMEGLSVEQPAAAERVSREMLIGPDAVNVQGVNVPKSEGLRRDMVMRPDEIHANLPAAKERRSEELLVRGGDIPPDDNQARPSGGVSKDMLIVRGDDKQKK